MFRIALFIIFASVLTACHPQHKTTTVKPVEINPKTAAIAPVKVEPRPRISITQPQITFDAPPPPLPSLLQGLSQDDLTMLEQRAEKSFPTPHWKVVAKNSRFVRSRVVDVLHEVGLPAELQVIPAIESRYNPYAVSSAGAAGLWQFMPSTARGLGLQCSDDLNELRDVEKSTRAAARYLQALQERFTYWPLALAAYNCGPTRLAKFLKKEGDWQPADGLNALPAPRASKAYVKNILSLAYAGHNGTRIFPQAETVRYVQQRGLDIRHLSKATHLSAETLLRYNPQLERTRYQSTANIALCLPDNAPWQSNHARQATSSRSHQHSKRITVKQGDSLWKIAHRHHITLSQLRQANRHLKKILHPGQKLRVPIKYPRWRNPLCQDS
ncbi:MAG: transglycosylase SLT domain-containing protein [Mariprofundaceae bacterium]|nr:transglycosylase SLT domain-containing protein [Mariprofundaceae bacterium]